MKSSLLRLSFFMLGLITVFTVTGCQSSSKKRDYEPNVARFYLEVSDSEVFASATLPISGVRVAVNSKPVITEFDIVSVEMAQSDFGTFLMFQLTSDAARDLYRLTGNNQGRRMVLTINGRPVGARQIDGPFGSGSIAVFVEVPDDLLPALVKNLNKTSEDIQKEKAKQKV